MAHSSLQKNSVNLWKQTESSTHLLLRITLDPTAKQSVSFKRSKNFLICCDSIMQSLARFLFSYRTTPNSTTGQTPAELFLNHRLRTRLDLTVLTSVGKYLTGRRIRRPDTLRLVKEENSPLLKKFWCKISVVSRIGLMAPLRISPVPSPFKFLSENNFGNDVLTKCPESI